MVGVERVKDKYSPGDGRLYLKLKVDATSLINPKHQSQRVTYKGMMMNVVMYLLASSEVLLWVNSPTAKKKLII